MPSTDIDVYGLGDVALQSGATLHDARLAYKTYGRLTDARDNVVVMPTYYGAHHVDLEPMMAAGRALDASRYFIVVPNMFGNGLSSSPSNTPDPQGRAAFPHVTIYDNVVCQHRLVREHLGIPHIRLVAGFSMGAQQAFQWGALFPDMIDAIAPICGTARTSPHNFVFLDGVKAALCADAAFKDGWYDAPPEKGLRAFGRVYAGWVYSQDFYRDREHVKLGLETVEDVMSASEARYLRRDANDLLANALDVAARRHQSERDLQWRLRGGARGDPGACDRHARDNGPLLPRTRQRAGGRADASRGASADPHDLGPRGGARLESR